MKIAIYGRNFSAAHQPEIQQMFNLIETLGVQAFVYEPFKEFMQESISFKSDMATYSSYEELMPLGVNYMISIGGDGTMLNAVTFVRNSGIPILGINTGRLGFLSSASKNELNQVFSDLINKNFTIDERSLLRLETDNNLFGEVNYALNELTIHKKESATMMTIHAYIDGEYLNSYWADGLIISTPTGSTAYSLSCGGPLMMPDSENFIIIPIATHNLNVRPIVVSDKNVITLKVQGREENYLAAMDSRTEIIDSSTVLTIRKENFKINLIRLPDQDFLKTLRNKLMWGMDLRN